MTDQIIVPTADAVIQPFLEKLYEQRPTSFPHLNLRKGVYWHPVLGFRAQAARMMQRLVALSAERRLKTATGQALLDYVASEYEAVPETESTVAVGKITLTPGGDLLGGTIPKGTRFTRAAFKALGIDVQTAEFETETDAYIPVSSSAPVTIPVRATRGGPHANTPILTASSEMGITFPERVADLTVTAFESAGGSDGKTSSAFDEFVRLYARAYAVGQYGPTTAASKLGALSGSGVRHMLAYDDVTTGSQKVLIADSAWGSSARWAGAVQQAMYDADLVGFGCKVSFMRLRNRVVAIEATVTLRDYNYLAETTEIELAIQKAVRSYFDDRIDWNVWNTDSLKSVIARCHPKIFGCPSVSVKDASTGATVSEIVTADYTAEQFHFYVASNATKLTFAGPS